MEVIHRSPWRKARLLIVTWHGISLDDEHEWSPGLYMSAAQFTRRLQFLKDSRCNVLPLAEGLARLRTHTLPERSVCLTFDDGFADFRLRALPVLESFGFPVTLYVTTEYLGSCLPLFSPALAYLAWSRRGHSFENWYLGKLPIPLDLRTADSRSAVVGEIIDFVTTNRLSLAERDQVLTSFAERTGADHNRLRGSRMLQLLSAEELKQASGSGVDVQLHTHYHSIPDDRTSLLADLRLNRNIIAELTGTSPTSFCYPSGIHFPDCLEWLREAGIRSAVTSVPRLVSSEDDSLLLPRYIDGCGRSDAEFEGWVSGLSNFIPGMDALRTPIAFHPAGVSGQRGKTALPDS